jgi:phosphoglycolate phosphatase
MPSLVGPRVEVYLSRVLKLLVFDLDGTLADTRLDLALSVNHALAAVGYDPLPLGTVVGFVGDGARNLLMRSLDAAGKPVGSPIAGGGTGADGIRGSIAGSDGGTSDGRSGEIIEEALAAFLAHYQAHCLGATAAYPGVKASLEKLSRYSKAVLTNKPEAPARTILAGLELAGHFNRILGGDNPHGPKPDPAALRHIMESEGASPSETVLIGDGVQDLHAARRAGTRFLGFLAGMGSPEALRAGNPEATFDDMNRLPEALAALEAATPPSGDR